MPDYSPFVQPIVDEALRRGIRVRPLPEMTSSYVILDYREQRRVVCQSIGEDLDTVTFRLLSSKAAGLRLLRERGFPVARTRLVTSLAEARVFLGEVRVMTLKPLAHTGGVGTTTHLRDPHQLAVAWPEAADASGRALAQAHLEGEAARLLVVGERTFALQRVPAEVEGDGTHTISQLIARHNAALRWSHHAIRVDAMVKDYLATMGYSMDSVLPKNASVPLSLLAHTKRGGFCHDITDLVAPEAVELARGVAADLGARLLAVDVVSEDIVHHGGAIVGVSPFTDLTRFHAPTSGKPRNAARAWLDVLFPGR